ncbi:MAG: hypothetical protein CME70_19340 [Halobacteriovorax sp.]|nr:hypothetical protein [Halobacteriovorax sp.]MBK26161.1 hypothetical protein [Halobacteriovorax sp.]|tara:strand:- start:474 stop:788 length:315 start_codon:yes stop_codon:yes gene_type:complete
MHQPVSLDEDLLKLVVNQCLALVLRDCLNDQGLNADDIKNVEYYPIWTIDRTSGGKKLLRLMVRIKPQKSFTELVPSCFQDAGFTLIELLEFFDRSDASRANPP